MKLPNWLRWRTDRELSEEIQAHLDLDTQDNIDRGLSPEEARHAALRSFGNPTRLRELARAADPLYCLETLGQDVRFGIRLLQRTPLLAVAIVLTLILGIGLNSSVFTILNAFLFRPLISRDPETFVLVIPTFSGRYSRQIHGSPSMLSLEEYEAFRTAAHSLAHLTASARVPLTLGGDSPTDVRGLFVSSNYLPAHFDPPLLGRTFLPEECAKPGGQPVAILNEALWRSQFQASPSIVGRGILLNKQKFTVIGVVPNQITGDVPQAAVFIPYTMQPQLKPPDDYFRSPAEHAWLDVSGRLNPGFTHRQTQAELQTIAARLDRLYPGRIMSIVVTNGSVYQHPFFASRAPIVLGLVMGSVTLILLIVCANVTTLLLSRAAARQQEMAIRLSLGAARGRLLRQLLTESLLLALIAASASWWLAYYLPRAILRLSADAPDIPLHPDWRVFAYTFAVAILAGCVAGLSPAFESLRLDLSASLKPLGRGGAGRTSSRIRRWLMAGQLAASIALLTGAGLILRAQNRLFRLEVGYDPQSVVITQLGLSRVGYDSSAARGFYRALIERVEALPGVSSVSIAHSAPFSGSSSTMINPLNTEDPRHFRQAFFRKVSPDYFRALGVRLVRGRAFTETEARAPSDVIPIVVSEAFSRTFWPGQDPLGKRVRLVASHPKTIGPHENSGEGGFGSRRRVNDLQLAPNDPRRLKNTDQRQVVGLAADTSSMRVGEKDGPLFYEPIHPLGVIDTVLIVRGTGEARSLIPLIRSCISELDSQLTAAPQTVGATIDRLAERYSFLLKVASIPVALAFVLCLLGTYGVAAFTVTQRTQEIGLRLAIGAQPGDVVRLLLRSMARPLTAALLAGFALAALLGNLFQRAGLLAGVKSIDPLSVTAACLLVACAALVATFIPARRAARLDPCRSLRDE